MTDTPEVVTPSEPVAAPVTTEGQASSWLDTLPPEIKPVVETKGWKSPADVVDSYRNLEKLRGVPAERLLTLPEDVTKDGALDPVWAKLGRPEAADKYTNALGEAFADDTFKDAAATAHKLGLSDKQFAGMQEWLKGTTGQIEAKRTAEVDAAFNDWSAANPQAVQNVQRLTAAVGVTDAAMDAALKGDKAALFDVLGKVAARMGEGQVVQGEQAEGFGLTASAAKAKIAQLMADSDFMKGYTDQNPRIRAPFVARMEKLHEAASK